MGRHTPSDPQHPDENNFAVSPGMATIRPLSQAAQYRAAAQQPPATPEPAPQQAKPSQRTSSSHAPRYGLRRALVLAIAAIVLLGIGVVVYKKTHRISYPDYEGQGEGWVLVEVAPGSTAGELAPFLFEKDIVKSEGAFLTAANNTAEITSLQPGFYQLHRKMSAQSAVDTLLNTDYRSGAVTIPEGSTVEDVRVVHGETVHGIYSRLAQASCYRQDDHEHCYSARDFRHAVLHSSEKELGLPKWAYKDFARAPQKARAIEGLIAPGLHIFNPSLSPQQIISHLIAESVSIYEKAGLAEAAKARHLTPYEVLIAASLIQREVPGHDYEKVARVIINRMRRNMPLQFDSTVNYALPQQEVGTTDAARAAETPWNTYVSPGLPATPICSPSAESIAALVDPEEGPWLYFVTVDRQGTTHFNATLKEHERDIEQARKNGVFDRPQQ